LPYRQRLVSLSNPVPILARDNAAVSGKSGGDGRHVVHRHPSAARFRLPSS
jgi:hypothetical protein